MHKYHFVARGVAPKREALRMAQEELAETQRILDEAKRRLQDVEEGTKNSTWFSLFYLSLYQPD